jgi:hypothetical protein
MRLNKILSLLPVATLMLVASMPAQAQSGFGFGFTKFGKHSAVSVGFSSGFGGGYAHHRPGRIVVVEPVRRFVPGHYETRCVDVWVPGCVKQVYVEPVYHSCVDPYGNVTRILIREGYFKTIQEPGHFETRCTEVWVPGHYV